MKKVSRRQFMRISALLTVGAAAAACTPGTPTPAPQKAAPTAAAKEQPTAAATAAPKSTSKYKEAPSLAQLVKDGKLPAVDERLPENPLSVTNAEGIGKYGGTWRLGFSGQADTYAAGQVLNRGLLKINEKLAVVPEMAESWEVSPDAKEFTFRLRKGLKWSDGNPLTSADVVYWFENVIKNTTVTKAIPLYLTALVEGKRVTCELTAPDAFTVKFKFATAKSLFYLDGNIVNNVPCQPAHYMKQWHGDLTSNKPALEAAMAAGNYKSWELLYNDKNNGRLNVDRPSYEPWIQNNSWKEELVTFRRNPYYWAIDKEGNQLPYIDKLQFRAFQDPEVYALWYVNGEMDCQARQLSFDRYTVLKENEKKGDYALQVWKQTAVACLHFNMTAKNAKLRELFSARDFRIAVSLGLDRDQLNDQFYEGLATKMQYSPPKGSPLYYEKLANAYVNYDLKKANDMLDALGYAKKDAEGYRLWKDGSGRVGWTQIGGAKPTDYELTIVDYMKKLGFQVSLKGMDRSLSIQLHNANDVEATLSNADRSLVPLADPQVWIKHTNIDDRPWCNAWTAWKMDPKNPVAEEPPKDHWIWKIWNTYDTIMETADEKKRNDLFFQILDIWAAELPSIGVMGDLPRLLPVKNGFKGPKAGNLWDCCSTSYEHIIDNAAWFWDQPEKHV